MTICKTINVLLLTLFVQSCTLSGVTPEQENLIVGTYKISETKELKKLYPNENLSEVTLEINRRSKFFLTKTPLIKGSDAGEWRLFANTDIPYISFSFISGKSEQAIYSTNFDTLTIISPKASKRGKEIDELIFVKSK